MSPRPPGKHGGLPLRVPDRTVGAGPRACPAPMDVIEIYLRVRRTDIAYIKFILESYEDFGIVRTIDRKKATIVVLAMPDFIDHVRAVLHALSRELELYEIPPPAEHEADGDWLVEKIRRGE